MSATDVQQLISETVWAILLASGPILLVGLGVGLVVSLLQALTSVQEMTLTFVPKLAAILITLALTTPFIFATLTRLSDRVFDIIMSGGF